jgi:hypothetical protein
VAHGDVWLPLVLPVLASYHPDNARFPAATSAYLSRRCVSICLGLLPLYYD